MTTTLRGADIVARTLERCGVERIFSLSGNHVMALYDAVLDTSIGIVHTRHEAAAVHMADAWGRLTGNPGIAMVTGGPGHANAVGALYTALAAESPMVLLSGHAGLFEIGRGGFQEIRQADMAAPVSKASYTAKTIAGLAGDVAEALHIASSGRPGPVHLSLPVDLLDGSLPAADVRLPEADAARPPAVDLTQGAARAVHEAMRSAARPLILAGPQFAHTDGRALLAALEAATGVPVVLMEAVRGIADATLGAFGTILKRADLVVLLAKPLDFTLKFGEPPFVAADARFVVVDPEATLIERAVRAKGEGIAFACLADARPSARALTATSPGRHGSSGWLAEAHAALRDRPSAWATLASTSPGRLHPLEAFRPVKALLERRPEAVLICDGGEFSQWAQAVLPVRRRLINSVAGAIGAAPPFAVAARLAEPKEPVIAILGDGTFGFHMAEIDTAVRAGTPFVAIVGNDQRWNAEHQIQLREYGAQRAHACDLLATRYDEVVTALGGHGELVTRAEEMAPALERALGCGKPACLNVMIESHAAPRF